MESIDLFSGIGGISLALKNITRTVLYCEIEPFCQNVLSERMESGDIEKAPIHADIRTLHLSDSMKPVMVCGGFPCQDISSIGLQKGIVDSERSSLFFEIMRLVDECQSIQYVFLENVANITKCGMEDVVTELTKRGFDMQWMMKSAGSMGAPHVRNRWFCLASRTSDHEMLSDCIKSQMDKDMWQVEPCARITFKPDSSISDDDSFDENWIQRCQCLGNTVVPPVVRKVFCTLALGCTKWDSIFGGLEPYAMDASKLFYPFPESGIIYKGKYIPLPTNQEEECHNVKISLVHDGKEITMRNFPTPRRGITHASSLTERSIRDLPTIMVNCNETKQYIRSKNIELSEKLHSMVIANVNYIEWMMGYPKDWTKSSKYKSQKSKSSKSQTDKHIEKEANIVEKPTKPHGVQRLRYNGMHVLMKEMPGKNIQTVAAAWRAMSKESKEAYTNKARAMSKW